MKRYKTLASCCMAVACMAALLVVLTGCSSQQSYTPPEKTPTLSSPTIGKDGTLRVGVNTDNQPPGGTAFLLVQNRWHRRGRGGGAG